MRKRKGQITLEEKTAGEGQESKTSESCEHEEASNFTDTRPFGGGFARAKGQLGKESNWENWGKQGGTGKTQQASLLVTCVKRRTIQY